MDRVVFIDRDGVINWDPIGDYIKKAEDFKFIEGVLEALKRLTDAGFKTVVISNQAGIGDGHYHKKDLDEITDLMIRAVKNYGSRIDGVYYCLHGKKHGCTCRKPEPGLLEQAAKDFSFDRAKTFIIGDKLSDVEAGRRFGLKTIMVLTGHGIHEKPKITAATKPDHLVADLAAAVDVVLQ